MDKLRWTKQVDSSSITAPSGEADAMATQEPFDSVKNFNDFCNGANKMLLEQFVRHHEQAPPQADDKNEGLLTIISASQPTLEQMSLRAFYDAVKSIEKDKIKSK